MNLTCTLSYLVRTILTASTYLPFYLEISLILHFFFQLSFFLPAFFICRFLYLSLNTIITQSSSALPISTVGFLFGGRKKKSNRIEPPLSNFFFNLFVLTIWSQFPAQLKGLKSLSGMATFLLPSSLLWGTLYLVRSVKKASGGPQMLKRIK